METYYQETVDLKFPISQTKWPECFVSAWVTAEMGHSLWNSPSTRCGERDEVEWEQTDSLAKGVREERGEKQALKAKVRRDGGTGATGRNEQMKTECRQLGASARVCAAGWWYGHGGRTHISHRTQQVGQQGASQAGRPELILILRERENPRSHPRWLSVIDADR